MNIKFGSACIDERGKINGGDAGDSTGREVCEEPMYIHSLGWIILRLKNKEYAMANAEAMKRACGNDCIGYDQNQRLGIISTGTRTTKKTECDCSSLVRICVIESTGIDPGNFTTANESDMLFRTGLFEKIVFVSQNKTPVFDGDILVTKTKGHTVIVTSGNPRREDGTNVSELAIVYRIKTIKSGWSEEKVSPNDIGVGNESITDIAISSDGIRYRVHVIGGKWLPWVMGYDINDYINGYAGNGKPIDCIQIEYNKNNRYVRYRVAPVGGDFFPYQYECYTTNNQDGYAGVYGRTINKFSLEIVDKHWT